MIMIEVINCPGYFVNELGEIFSEHSNKFIKPGKAKYHIVGLKNIDGKYTNYSVHRLVAQAYLGLNIEDTSIQVDHIDRNKFNNHVSNLRLVTCSDNMKHRAGRLDIDTLSHKLCAKCKNLVPRWNFSKSSNAFDGLQSYCKPCNKCS